MHECANFCENRLLSSLNADNAALGTNVRKLRVFDTRSMKTAPNEVNEMAGKVKTEAWAIAINDWPSFDIVPAKGTAGVHSDEWLNGVYPSRLVALERVIDDFETTKAKLSKQIARAKRMRRRITAQRIEARSAETPQEVQPERREPGPKDAP